MDHALISEQSIEIAAKASKVWELLTNPEKIKVYLFGTQTETSWKPGTPIAFHGSWNGTEYHDKGTVMDYQEDRLLSYTYWSSMGGMEDKPENYIRVKFSLEDEDEQTRLTLTQEGAKNKEALEHSESNWKTVLEKIKEMAENE
jgi:uncharacterized protein YndB with AHSA1/START domain